MTTTRGSREIFFLPASGTATRRSPPTSPCARLVVAWAPGGERRKTAGVQAWRKLLRPRSPHSIDLIPPPADHQVVRHRLPRASSVSRHDELWSRAAPAGAEAELAKRLGFALRSPIQGRDGTIRVYDPTTNTFGSYTASGATRTFYKPDPAIHKFKTNLDYWNAQPGSSPWTPKMR